MKPVSRVPRRYFVEFSLAMVLYIAALFGRVFLLRQVDDRVLAAVITLAPILPIGLMGVAIFRFYRGVDEFHRLRFLKVTAITAGLTAAATASWSFLEDIGVPPVNNFGVLFIFMGTFTLAGFLFRVEDALSEGRIGRFVRGITWLSVFVFASAALWFAVANILGLPWLIPLCLFAIAATIAGLVSLHIGPTAGPV